MLRLRVSKDGVTVKCPAAHRTILTKSCSQGENEHCACFNGVEYSGSVAFVMCDYGVEDRRMSIIVPSQFRVGN